jgi:DNA-binding FadR family transcriptional regulator
MARAFELFSFDFPHISRETFADVQGFRVLLEVASADQLIERASESDVAELRAINAGLLTARSIPEAAEVDFRMHLRLVSILDNRAILDVYGMMKPVILRIMANRKTRRTFETTTYSEHEAVIDALAARDRIAYQYRLQSHLEFGFAHFDEAMEPAET